jgi:hypothetical protein
VAHIRKSRGAHSVLLCKPEGKTPSGSARYRREHNIKINIQGVHGGITELLWLRIGACARLLGMW